MFDYVDFKMKCPKCSADLRNFQTKDTECTMKTVRLYQVSNFYQDCECGAWIEFFRKEDLPENEIDKFDMRVTGGKTK